MRIILLLPPDFDNIDKFNEEVEHALSLYSYNTDYKDFEYIYPICKNQEMYKAFFDFNDIKNTFGFKPNYKKYKSNAFYKNILTMIDYAKEDDANLLITLYDIYSNDKNYKKNLRKINKTINIYLITYEVTIEPIKCCNQYISMANSDNHFDYLYCDCCGMKIILLQNLMDLFLINSIDYNIIQRKNFLKGEM